MRKILFLTLVINYFFSSAQQSESIISVGTLDSLYSPTLKETRKLWVYVPDIDTSRYTDKLPVVYLLDGNVYFYSMTDYLMFLSSKRKCPKMIIIGIPNETSENRTRDLTTSHVTSTGADSNEVKTSGGAENFTMFLEKELMPYIEKRYPASTNRMLVGHSNGGLFAINAMINHPNLFNYYVVIDPSMWWDNRKLLKQTEKALKQNKFDNKMLYLAIANDAGMDTALVRKDKSDDTKHTRAILELKDDLKKYSFNGLKWNSKYYPDEDHGTIPVPSEYDALRFFFKGFRFEFGPLYDEKLSADAAQKLLLTHYKKYNLLPPEPILNALGYDFLNRKMFDKSKAFFQLEIECYPKSANALDSLGDYYSAQNEKQKAIDNYTKALALKFHTETKNKLDKLKLGN